MRLLRLILGDSRVWVLTIISQLLVNSKKIEYLTPRLNIT